MLDSVQTLRALNRRWREPRFNTHAVEGNWACRFTGEFGFVGHRQWNLSDPLVGKPPDESWR